MLARVQEGALGVLTLSGPPRHGQDFREVALLRRLDTWGSEHLAVLPGPPPRSKCCNGVSSARDLLGSDASERERREGAGLGQEVGGTPVEEEGEGRCG